MADGRREGSQTPFAHNGVTEGEGESITVAGSTSVIFLSIMNNVCELSTQFIFLY